MACAAVTIQSQGRVVLRALAERTRYVELGQIRSQREDWQREASVHFGKHRTHEGLSA
jgi:hypothetical protein